MGPIDSKQLKRQQIREKNWNQIEDIYNMYEETIIANQQISDTHHKIHSQAKNSTHKNRQQIESILNQLLQGFDENKKYIWGEQIPLRFKKHFSKYLSTTWINNKQFFYKELLNSMDLNQNLKLKIERSAENQSMRQRNYQKYFYDEVMIQIQNKLQNNQKSLQIDYTQDTQQINKDIINSSLASEEEILANFQLNNSAIMQSDSDYLPFLSSFINPRLEQHKAKIQNSSIILPETIFIDRLSVASKTQIAFLITFYRQFANILDQLLNSSTLISCPLKHFIYYLQQKMERKHIKSSPRIKKMHQSLLLAQNQDGRCQREKREKNNNMLLIQIRDFTDAFTNFAWKYLELQPFSLFKLSTLINIDTFYGIVLKNIWKYVECMSLRGYEYEEYKLKSIYQNFEENSVCSHISDEKKKYILKVLQTMRGQKNPQKYLKKIVIFYRQVSKLCETADDLLNLYEITIITAIKNDFSDELGLFRMKNVIEKVLKMDQNSTGGEISYSWTTWCIAIEVLKQRLDEQIVCVKEKQWENIMVQGSL